ncbi:tail fiber protein [Escherichia phage NC-A]|uniref:Tail fibers protein n=1 Tax=Escherichia phage NC-A TaxID=2528528 RepID=A0A481S219_9CAUD|nr:tail fiber protein [Escherichia phage NC-A]QBG78753.1 tail fibers protein [Escherichia phage NC-A]
MANVIKTVLTYQLDGSNRDFNIPFEYLARKFVVVTLIGVDRKVLMINTDYRFATRTTISLTKAWGPADGYTTIELRRVTSTTDRLVDFTDGSILRAYDLNVAQIQTVHVAEEARDLTADTIGVNNDGHLDARGRRIVNLANAVDDRDAVPFGQLKAMNQNSWQARNEALQFRNEAETFRNQAEGFKNESGTNATNTYKWRNEAEGFRNEAEQFKNTATQQATAAGGSAAAARQSEVNAAASAAASANSATLAEQQADRAEREADKLGNWNALAGAIEGVNENDVTFKGDIKTPMDVEAGGLISTGAGHITKGLSVGEALDVKGVTALHKDVWVDGVVVANGGIQQQSAPNTYNDIWRMFIKGVPAHIGNRQGLHIGWNETSNGESDFVTNKGAGGGGFVFRTVNFENSAEIGRVTFMGNGAVRAFDFQAVNGARIEAGNNIIGASIFSGMGSCQFDTMGNLLGGLWNNVGGDLYNYLQNKAHFAKPPGGVQLFTARGVDYLEGLVDNTAVGFRWFLSDRRLKENIKVVRSADDMLNIIRSYIPVSYKYKDSEYTDNRGRTVTVTGKKSRAGFITQDLIRIWPEAVDVLSDGMQSPDPNQIIGGLMLLVKNLDERVQELEKKNNV